MPRTLFNSYNPDLLSDSQPRIASHYRWLPEIEVIPVEGKHLTRLIEQGFKDFIQQLCEKKIFKKMK